MLLMIRSLPDENNKILNKKEIIIINIKTPKWIIDTTWVPLVVLWLPIILLTDSSWNKSSFGIFNFLVFLVFLVFTGCEMSVVDGLLVSVSVNYIIFRYFVRASLIKTTKK